MLLKDKVCIVVGAGSIRGIGHATARLFAEHGAMVVAADLHVPDEVAADLGAKEYVLALTCDVTRLDQCEDMVRQARDRFGRVDCVVNSAGIVDGRSFLDIDDAQFDRMMTINLKGTFNVCKAVLPVMAEQRAGSIVNVSSLAAQRGGGLVGGAHYAASKGGVLSLTRSIAREFGPAGIRANAVCPAMIETAMLDGMPPEREQAIIDQIPLRRLGRAAELAGACLFLASELGGFVTGATIDVNGGTHIH
jgi:NAD(P)-dependent dehydrogenase (short-subunit alcohol dehydrogenase family)